VLSSREQHQVQLGAHAAPRLHKEIEMTRSIFVLAAATAVVAGSMLAAQQPPGAKPTMGFFVTSTPIGDGANLGGLQGADAHCQKLAAASGQAGAGDRVWRAYLSTQGPNAVNARDRIGAGPWINARGQQIAANAAELHGDTLEQARLGNRINKLTALSEKGEPVNGVGDKPNQHDILTGSQPDGRAFPAGKDMTCNNYTSNGEGTVMVGHHDRIGGPNASWNAVHASKGCSQANLIATGGNAYLYCFAEK
jgi:hypothetical protein